MQVDGDTTVWVGGIPAATVAGGKAQAWANRLRVVFKAYGEARATMVAVASPWISLSFASLAILYPLECRKWSRARETDPAAGGLNSQS